MGCHDASGCTRPYTTFSSFSAWKVPEKINSEKELQGNFHCKLEINGRREVQEMRNKGIAIDGF